MWRLLHLLLNFMQGINLGVHLAYCGLGDDATIWTWLIKLKLKWLTVIGSDLLFPLYPTDFCVWLHRGKKWPVGRRLFEEKGVWTCVRPVRPAGVCWVCVPVLLCQCWTNVAWQPGGEVKCRHSAEVSDCMQQWSSATEERPLQEHSGCKGQSLKWGRPADPTSLSLSAHTVKEVSGKHSKIQTSSKREGFSISIAAVVTLIFRVLRNRT